MSPATVKRQWTMARAWLKLQLESRVTPEHWARIKDLFQQALEQPHEDRRAWLERPRRRRRRARLARQALVESVGDARRVPGIAPLVVPLEDVAASGRGPAGCSRARASGLRDRPGDRTGRDGRGVPGARHAPGPRRRAQGAAARGVRRSGHGGSGCARGRGGRDDHPSGRGHGLRARGDRRTALHRQRVRGRPLAARSWPRAPLPAGRAVGLAHRDRGRAARGARRRRRAPRPEAGERAADDDRAVSRWWTSASRTWRYERHAADPARRRPGHPGLHGTRAAGGRAGG